MKKTILTTVSVILTFFILLPSFAKTYPPGTGLNNWVRTIDMRVPPIVLEPIIAPVETGFWFLMAAHVLIDVLESSAEPLPHYEAGIYIWSSTTTAKVTFENHEYPDRTTVTTWSYNYNPVTRTEYWLKQVTFTASGITTVSSTTTPPLVREFLNSDFEYNRVGSTEPGQTSFYYKTYAKVTAYVIRRGTLAWGRPVRASMVGWVFAFLMQNDSPRKNLLYAYEDTRWVFLGPNGLVTWVPARIINTEFSPNGNLVTAFYSFPQ